MLNCKWMTLELKSPFVMASLTLVSNVNIKNHLAYYEKVYNSGAGAIVLPSINPSVKGNPNSNLTIADCLTFNNGVLNSTKMGFTVLGPVKPNIVSLNYGVNLARSLKLKNFDIPIIGSITNIGKTSEILYAAESITKTGVDGIEMNISCPNAYENGINDSIVELLYNIKNKCCLPLSLKISPYHNLSKILNSLNGAIDSLTLSNAYVGLMPPDISDTTNLSPFKRRSEWAPCGIYGPFERLLTYNTIYSNIKSIQKNNLSLACVGGLFSEDDVISALMLGADIVQISSGILWKGVSIFSSLNKKLSEYMYTHNVSEINVLKGCALKNIKQDSNQLKKVPVNEKIVDNSKCRKCNPCNCCDKLCLAIQQSQIDYSVNIDQDLCSGCGMCMELCHNSAIKIVP